MFDSPPPLSVPGHPQTLSQRRESEDQPNPCSMASWRSCQVSLVIGAECLRSDSCCGRCVEVASASRPAAFLSPAKQGGRGDHFDHPGVCPCLSPPIEINRREMMPSRASHRSLCLSSFEVDFHCPSSRHIPSKRQSNP